MLHVRRSAAVLGLLALGTACASPTAQDLTLYHFGAVTVHATGGANATALASTSAIFFDAYSASIPDSRTPQNYCQYSTVDTTSGSTTGEVGAGSPLSLTFGAGTATVPQTLSYDNTAKRYLSPAPVTYKAGDSVKVAIPGLTGGFAASNIAVRLAEPLFPSPVTLPTSGDMVITWNAVNDETSAIVISLKYANPATASFPNEQIICVLKDDGNETIPATALGPVLASPAAMRSLLLTRWRTQLVQPNSTSLLHIVSSIDTLVKLQ